MISTHKLMVIINLAMNHFKTFCLFLCVFIATINSVSAKDYMVEALVFKNIDPSQAMESHNYTTPRQFESEAETWLLEPSLLLTEAAAIDDSERYQLMHHYAWGQESLPVSLAAAFNVIETDLQGSIKVYAKQLLFANLDLEFDGYRLNEKRRIKLNEKHFFDHPKFGVLIQVSRLEEKDEEELEDPDQALEQ